VIPTLTLGLLGAIESLLCARVADNMTTSIKRHDANQELMAQGIANMVSPLFAGMPATGTIARTVTNIRAGASSPIAGMVHAVTLLLILLIAAPLAAKVPLAALAAILLFVAFNMGEWQAFAKLRQYKLTYRTVLLGTFALTVIVDLMVAVEVGLVLACVFFIYRVAALTRIEPIALSEADTAQGIRAHTLYGMLFFGAVTKIEALQDSVDSDEKARVLVLDASQLINLDTTGLEALESLHTALKAAGGQLIISGLNEQPQSLMMRSGFAATLGAQQLVATREEALIRARVLAAPAP
jgi:SulP family sulfate permease